MQAKTTTLLATLFVVACGTEPTDTNYRETPPAQLEVTIGESFQSECLRDMADSEGVRIDVNGNTATITDTEAEFNCCLDVWMEVTVEGREITVVETEDPDATGACDCMCPYTLSVEISGLEGQYTIRVYRGAQQPELLLHTESITAGSESCTDCGVCESLGEAACIENASCSPGYAGFCDCTCEGPGGYEGGGCEGCPAECFGYAACVESE